MDKIYIPDKEMKGINVIPIEEWFGRYSVILLMCENSTVLDVGCKQGYGAYLLSNWAKRVVASDREDNINTSVEFVKADWVEDDVETIFKEKFDIVNCMEVLEHVNKPEKIVKNCSKVLKKDGVGIFTVPCVDRKSSLHIKPFFTEDEIVKLIQPYFNIILLKSLFTVSWFVMGKLK